MPDHWKSFLPGDADGSLVAAYGVEEEVPSRLWAWTAAWRADVFIEGMDTEADLMSPSGLLRV